MTGAENFAEAERLVGLCKDRQGYVGSDPIDFAALAAAQVHATLALAAATAHPAERIGQYSGESFGEGTRDSDGGNP